MKPEYKCGCGEEVDAVGILGTTETYPAEACGICGLPICTDCYDDSRWMWDGHQCCATCNDTLVKEAEHGPS